jgi:hypothetical protein
MWRRISWLWCSVAWRLMIWYKWVPTFQKKTCFLHLHKTFVYQSTRHHIPEGRNLEPFRHFGDFLKCVLFFAIMIYNPLSYPSKILFHLWAPCMCLPHVLCPLLLKNVIIRNGGPCFSVGCLSLHGAIFIMTLLAEPGFDSCPAKNVYLYVLHYCETACSVYPAHFPVSARDHFPTLHCDQTVKTNESRPSSVDD